MPPGVEIRVHIRIKTIMSQIMTASSFAKTIVNFIGTFQDPDTVQDTGTGDGEEREHKPKVSAVQDRVS